MMIQTLGDRPGMTLQFSVYVHPHPLVKHWLGVARDAATPSVLFFTSSAMTDRTLAHHHGAVRD